MTTQTLLSAATSVSVAQALLPVHCCCGKDREMARIPPSLFLIANLELEFRPTHRKLSPLKIPNRKFLTIFAPAFPRRPLGPHVTRRLLPGSLDTDEGPHPSVSNLRFRD